MDSYLKGRPKAVRLHANIPPQKLPQPPRGKNQPEEEQVIEAETEPGVTNAPKVDLVMRDGAVRRIIIHLEDGRQLELDCLYEGEE